MVYNTQWDNLFNINENLNYPITSIYYNNEVNIYGSSCMDGSINIYTFPTNKKLNSIKVEGYKYADFFFISSSPLPSFIFYCSKNLTFYSYSLTGNQLAKESHEYGDIFSPILFNDKYNCDYLIYGDEEGLIHFRKMPKLELIFTIEVSDNPIKCLDISEDKGYCYVWTDEGQEIILVKDRRVMTETDQLLLWHMTNDFS
jgi:WD40 repeat protein